MIAQVQLDDVRLGDEFEVDILDLDHQAAVHGLMFVRVVVLVRREGRTDGHQGGKGDELREFHVFSFQDSIV